MAGLKKARGFLRMLLGFGSFFVFSIVLVTNVQNWLSVLGLSESSPEFAAALLLVLIILVLVAGVLFRMGARQKDLREEILRLNEAVQASEAVQLRLMRDQISGIREEIAHAGTVQSNHFANFLKLSQNGSDSQEQRLERVGQNLSAGLEQVREALAKELSSLRQDNDKALACMREANDKALAALRDTVDEKLQTTLNTRISESFKTVEEQLAAVHQGLGEMREIAGNVDGLRRVLSNVKTRGVFGEMQLSLLLEEILTPEQYCTNIATRPGSSERVEFAVRLPGAEDSGHVLLPIDAKFPLEDYQRLLEARQACDAQAQSACLKALSARILSEAKKIHDKYVEVPYTTEFAVMYLPVESLWSEVLSIAGLAERVQREFHVTIAGPSVLAAFLNSLQMGFRTLAIEKRSAEVWRLLGEIKSEFLKFSDALGSMEKKVEGIRSTLDGVRIRTNVMSRRLRSVEAPNVQQLPQSQENDFS